MEVIRDYEDDLTAEKIMLYVKCRNKNTFMDLAEDLLDDMKDEGILHPAIAYEWVTASRVEGDTVYFGEIPFECRILAEKMKIGSRACITMTTVGKQTDDYSRELDDDLDRYIMQGVMQLCLSDTGNIMAGIMKEAVPERHMLMIKPGVEGVCEMAELDHLLALLPAAPAELGVERREDGLMMPVYTNLSLFFLTDGENNLPAEDADDEEVAAFGAELNRAAGHV